MMGSNPSGPSVGKLSVLERALSKKQAPMKPGKAMNKIQKPPKKG